MWLWNYAKIVYNKSQFSLSDWLYENDAEKWKHFVNNIDGRKKARTDQWPAFKFPKIIRKKGG